jgi:integrase
MRQGEVLSIRGGDIGEAVLNVAHSWSAADGLKSPKNGEARRVPLLPEVREALLAQLATTPHTDIPEAEPLRIKTAFIRPFNRSGHS